MNKLSDFDLGWLVGIIDGEGWIGSNKDMRGGLPYPTIKVCMTDEDSVVRLHEMTGVGTFRPYTGKQKEHHKDAWCWTVATESDVLCILAQIQPHMSLRRQEACWSVIELIDRKRDLRSLKASQCGLGHSRAEFGYVDKSGAQRCRECSAGYSRAAYAKIVARRQEESS